MLDASPAPFDDHPPVDRMAMAGEASGIEQAAYESLAAFRVEIRRFLAFSKEATENVGLAPVQYQAMLALKAHGDMTITQLAAELFIKVQTAVGLVDRMTQAGLVTRTKSAQDRRRIVLDLTPRAEKELEALATMHLRQLQVAIPDVIAILSRMDSIR